MDIGDIVNWRPGSERGHIVIGAKLADLIGLEAASSPP